MLGRHDVTSRYKTYTLQLHLLLSNIYTKYLGNHFNKRLLSNLRCIGGWWVSCRIWFTNSSVSSFVFSVFQTYFPLLTCIWFLECLCCVAVLPICIYFNLFLFNNLLLLLLPLLLLFLLLLLLSFGRHLVIEYFV